jgi:GMP synthase-like glutamine amidotransferase
MILIINICKEKLHELEFVKPVEDILKNQSINFFTKHCIQLKNSDIEKADKIIICGTSLKDNDFLMHLDKFSWIKNTKKQILGICGGAHIIGLILGNKLKKKKEIGLKDLIIRQKFLGSIGKLQVYHLHQFHILPEVFHKNNIYATLFHPEVRNKNLIAVFAKL